MTSVDFTTSGDRRVRAEASVRLSRAAFLKISDTANYREVAVHLTEEETRNLVEALSSTLPAAPAPKFAVGDRLLIADDAPRHVGTPGADLGLVTEVVPNPDGALAEWSPFYYRTEQRGYGVWEKFAALAPEPEPEPETPTFSVGDRVIIAEGAHTGMCGPGCCTVPAGPATIDRGEVDEDGDVLITTAEGASRYVRADFVTLAPAEAEPEVDALAVLTERVDALTARVDALEAAVPAEPETFEVDDLVFVPEGATYDEGYPSNFSGLAKVVSEIDSDGDLYVRKVGGSGTERTYVAASQVKKATPLTEAPSVGDRIVVLDGRYAGKVAVVDIVAGEYLGAKPDDEYRFGGVMWKSVAAV